jgi:sugar-phosphatase
MQLDTAIFDMDGLLIDSEPLWYEAAKEVLLDLGHEMDEDAYATTIGLRTSEFIEHWFRAYGIGMEHAAASEKEITERVIRKVRENGTLMPGVMEAMELIEGMGLRIGLATSSPLELVDAVLERTGLTGRFEALHSAEHLTYGKPHPQVYLDCARSLGSHPMRMLRRQLQRDDRRQGGQDEMRRGAPSRRHRPARLEGRRPDAVNTRGSLRSAPHPTLTTGLKHGRRRER